ncbi:MAG: sugar transferase [Clostridia bacterium]|nr:sugar transferase [Clostridia bacterium]
MYRRFFKRLFDILFSLLALIVLALPMLIIAIAVKCTSKGPAIFKVERVGKNGKPFKFYKFRSMRTNAPKDCAPRYLHSEDYITKVGAFLRKTSLDELPQLWCILKGDMSLIGPRPCGFSEVDLIEARKKYGAYAVRPGLTGLAQVNGRDVLACNVEKKAQFDGEYAKKITFWKDLKIIFQTIGVVLREDNVVEGTAAVETTGTEAENEAEAATQTATELLDEVAATEREREEETAS